MTSDEKGNGEKQMREERERERERQRENGEGTCAGIIVRSCVRSGDFGFQGITSFVAVYRRPSLAPSPSSLLVVLSPSSSAPVEISV
jgi:hypothetical protein